MKFLSPRKRNSRSADPIQRVGILSHGLWQARGDVATLLGAQPVRIAKHWPARIDAVAGWGFKPTATPARALACARDIPYLALEDGFLRSVVPGSSPSLSYVVDRTGIYYDAHQPSDLEALLQASGALSEVEIARGQAAADLLRSLKLSKYNTTKDARRHPPIGILVVDQTVDDASITGALAGVGTFVRMLEAAIAQVGRAAVFVKLHPETISGRKHGHLRLLAREHGVAIVEPDHASWSVIGAARAVYTVSSQLGFEALLAQVPVTCFGMPFYAGWGLTQDRIACARRTARPSLGALAASALLHYTRYLDPWTRRGIAFEAAVEALAFLRDRYHENAMRSVLVGFSKAKAVALAPLLEGPAGPPRWVRHTAHAPLTVETGEQLIVWGDRHADLVARARRDGVAVLRAEDGFVRSAGLGSAFVPSCSFVLDDLGMYYDPEQPSRFEALALAFAATPALRARATALRTRLRAAGITKYGALDPVAELPRSGRRKLLVVGQVEDDASIRLGTLERCGNLGLLRRVRVRHPDAFLIYRPHPDVVRGYRRGRLAREQALEFADAVVARAPIADLLEWCDGLETSTSLAGFEALLRGKPVTVHGRPFYGGWGLTEDLLSYPNRTRSLDLDELVAVSLLLYPGYVDPVSGLPCPAELLIERLAAHDANISYATRLREAARHWQARFRHTIIGPAARVLRRSR